MKTTYAFTLVLIAILAGPAQADTTATTSLAGDCQLVGPLANAADDCMALRVVFQAEINQCMDQLRAEADARAGSSVTNNSHGSRARFLMCDAATRERLHLLSN